MTSFPMLEWAQALFDLPRSITGQGTRDSLAYLKEREPSLENWSVRSGTEVFDWTVPKEWNVKNAYLEHESGVRFADWKINNLHLVNYSTPIDTVMSHEELFPHLHSLPDQPDRIPYITSYYHPRWGFCISQNDLEQMPHGKYRVVIESELSDGELTGTHALVSGEFSEEILFSTNIC